MIAGLRSVSVLVVPATPSATPRISPSSAGDVVQGDVGALQKRLARLDVRAELRLALDQPLQRHRPLGRRGVFAGKRDPPARADLVLQPEQIELVALQLREQPLADQHAADAGRRDGMMPAMTASDVSVRGCRAGVGRLGRWHAAYKRNQDVHQFRERRDVSRRRLVGPLQHDHVDRFFVEVDAADGLGAGFERLLEDVEAVGDRRRRPSRPGRFR